MSDDESEELRRLAQHATSGPWELAEGPRIVTPLAKHNGEPYKHPRWDVIIAEGTDYDDYGSFPDDATMAYIAACSPERVVAMCDRVRELELGREADRRRITELETAARAFIDARRAAQEQASLSPGCFDRCGECYLCEESAAIDVLRSVLAAEHTPDPQ